MTSVFPWHVDFADTDAGGVVYHARYLEWAERARAAMLRQAGLSNVALQQQGAVFAVRRLQVGYDQPARLDDLLLIETAVQQVQGARLMLCQNIRKDAQIIANIDVQLAFLKAGRPCRIPANIHHLLTGS